jgi:hypothetical protein
LPPQRRLSLTGNNLPERVERRHALDGRLGGASGLLRPSPGSHDVRRECWHSFEMDFDAVAEKFDGEERVTTASQRAWNFAFECFGGERRREKRRFT